MKYSEGSDPPEDLEVDSVPPYEDRLGPDGAEGENPVLPPQVLALFFIPKLPIQDRSLPVLYIQHDIQSS